MSTDRRAGVYVISVAATLVRVHPRTLRIYEAEGLISPSRRNNLRLYSDEDIERLGLIRLLVGELGVNLAGTRLLLALHDAGRYRLDELLALVRGETIAAGGLDRRDPPAAGAAEREG